MRFCSQTPGPRLEMTSSLVAALVWLGLLPLGPLRFPETMVPLWVLVFQWNTLGSSFSFFYLILMISSRLNSTLAILIYVKSENIFFERRERIDFKSVNT